MPSFRKQTDGWNWSRMSKGVGNKSSIGTNKCIEKSKNCPAFKRRWICRGKCNFKHNFCCDYIFNEDTEAQIFVYDSQHNHEMKRSEEITKFKEYSEKLESLTTSSNVSPLQPNNNEVSDIESFSEEDLQNKNGTKEETEDISEWISRVIKSDHRYRKSLIKKTIKTKITEDEMSDTFHIIEKDYDERPFDATNDGYIYNRHTSTKNFPEIFTNQQTTVYTCTGRLKCLNDECDIFKRIKCLS